MLRRFGALLRRTRPSLVILIALVPFAFVSPAQAWQQGRGTSAITWSRTYVPIIGGPVSIQLTSDGGFVAASRSANAWVMKASFSGEPEWEKEYTPTGYTNTQAESVQQTRDQGYIVAGYALSLGYVTSFDAWLLKLDHKGNVEWSRTYGGRAGDAFGSVQQTRDGEYVVAGTTESFGPNVQISGETAWVMKVDSKGNVVWEKDFGADQAQLVRQTSDDGFIVVGTAAVGNQPNADAWVFKLDPNGDMIWQKTFEITTNNRGYSVQQTRDGGYVIVAEILNGFLSSEALITRLDSQGNILWQKLYNGGGFTQTSSVLETSDGGFIVAGRFLQDHLGHGADGPWLLKLDSIGNMVWQKTYGGINDFFFQVQETRRRGLIVAGALATYCCGYQAWVLNIDSFGNIEGCRGVSPSKATVTDVVVVATNATVTNVNTNALVVETAVTVQTLSSTLHTLCLGTVDEKVREAPDRNMNPSYG